MLIAGAGEFVEFNGQLVDKQWLNTNYPNSVGWKGYKKLADIAIVPDSEYENRAIWRRVDFGLPTSIQSAKISFTFWRFNDRGRGCIRHLYRTSQDLNTVYTLKTMQKIAFVDASHSSLIVSDGVAEEGLFDGITTGSLGLKTITLSACVNPYIEFFNQNLNYSHNRAAKAFLRGIEVCYN